MFLGIGSLWCWVSGGSWYCHLDLTLVSGFRFSGGGCKRCWSSWRDDLLQLSTLGVMLSALQSVQLFIHVHLVGFCGVGSMLTSIVIVRILWCEQRRWVWRLQRESFWSCEQYDRTRLSPLAVLLSELRSVPSWVLGWRLIQVIGIG